MSETVAMMIDILERMLDLDIVRKANAALENGSEIGIWSELEELGIARMTLPEAEGGAECDWSELGEVVMALARSGVPTPLPEEVAARALCHELGIAQPEDRVVIARSGDQCALGAGAISGKIAAVPWGRHSAYVLTAVGAQIILVDVTGIAWKHGVNLGFDARDDVELSTAKVVASVERADANDLIDCVGALVRAAQIAGAAARALDLTVAYAAERRQFDRPIAAFQAIQQQTARLAEESLAATLAARCGFSAFGGPEAATWAAIAKIRAGVAGSVAAAIAHQVHGAIGFTMEHHLRFFTQRMNPWRREFGTDTHWAEILWNDGIPADTPPWHRLATIGEALSARQRG